MLAEIAGFDSQVSAENPQYSGNFLSAGALGHVST